MKYALLIGINYRGSDCELSGCINDVLKIKGELINNFGYEEQNITLLTEDTVKKPNAQTIIDQITNLIFKSVSNPDAEFWIHYSGHGASIVDTNSDEKDGMDEVIVPLDYEKSGIITDDTLHQLLQYLPIQTKCICFFDCCHSGTILDLKYKYNVNGAEILDNPTSRIKAQVFMISGCKDDQTSADFFNQTNSNWAGAMTTAFINVMKSCNYKINCHDLLINMQTYMNNNNFSQIPQMTSSFHIHKTTSFCNKKSSINSIVK